jgi:hypothetical protein
MNASQSLGWTLRAIARLERTGDVRQRRLTETGLAHWRRFSRHPGLRDFIGILHEDLASAFPLPFDFTRWPADPLANLDEATAGQLVEQAARPDDSDTLTFLRSAALDLGLPANGAIADLPRLGASEKALEMPGSGGRIAAQQALSQPSISFAEDFTFVAPTFAERLVIGLAAVELRANEPRVLDGAQAAIFLRENRIDRVLGVSGSREAADLAAQLNLKARWSA